MFFSLLLVAHSAINYRSTAIFSTFVYIYLSVFFEMSCPQPRFLPGLLDLQSKYRRPPKGIRSTPSLHFYVILWLTNISIPNPWQIHGTIEYLPGKCRYNIPDPWCIYHTNQAFQCRCSYTKLVPSESVMGKMKFLRNLGVQALRTLIVWAFGLQLGATKRGGQRATSKRCLHDRP